MQARRSEFGMQLCILLSASVVVMVRARRQTPAITGGRGSHALDEGEPGDEAIYIIYYYMHEVAIIIRCGKFSNISKCSGLYTLCSRKHDSLHSHTHKGSFSSCEGCKGQQICTFKGRAWRPGYI